MDEEEEVIILEQKAEVSTSQNEPDNVKQSSKDDLPNIVAEQTSENVQIKQKGWTAVTDFKKNESSTSSEDKKGHADEDVADNLKKKSFEAHPYKEVLERFRPTGEQLSLVTNIEVPRTLKETPLCEIYTKEDLEKLITNLKQEKEIGVDVEYSDHGYKAETVLIQISTTEIDYIIDAIQLKDHMSLLDQVLANSDILKIFHASMNDLKWLQQDFRLFVVNMFDTQQAIKALAYPKIGLEVLLKDYNVIKDKSLQRADFRKRPLPPNYKEYARTDSHYLIPSYYKLKNDLIKANLLEQVFTTCNNHCKVVYETVEDFSYVSVVDDLKKTHQRQLKVLEKLNKWRHELARSEDKNTGYILSKNNMKMLALEMPTNPGDVLRIAQSNYVRNHLDAVVKILVEGDGNKNKRKFHQTDFSRSQVQGTSNRQNAHYGRYNKKKSQGDQLKILPVHFRSNNRGRFY